MDGEQRIVDEFDVPHSDSERYLASCVRDLLADCSQDEPETTPEDLDPMYDELEFQLSELVRDRYPERFSGTEPYLDDDFSWVWEFEISESMLDLAIAQMTWWNRLENSSIPLDCRESPELWPVGDEEARRMPDGSADRVLAEGAYDDPEVEPERLGRIRELKRRAADALSSRSLEDYSEVLEDLLDIREELGISSEWEPGPIEHWMDIIDLPDDREREDVEVTVIRLIDELSAALCNLIARDRRALHQIDWRQLEHVIATALSGIGFEVVLTPPSKDGGKDVVATCWLRGKRQTFFIELKHWRSGKRVNSDPVFDFLEVNVTRDTTAGLFLSTSGFSRDV